MEVFKIRVLNDVGGKNQVLAIAGSNVRGSIFGVYDFEQKHLGVDPFWFWGDNEPPTQGELIFDSSINHGPTKEPTWKYRGWTLNDHPQFNEWLESGLVQRTRNGRYMFAIHQETLNRLWEAALRLKMNMFTWYFIDIDWQPDYERLQAAVDRGLLITQHQMEGIGADTGFWDDYWEKHNAKGKPEIFSYAKHPESFHEFWQYYINRWCEFSPQVVWEINLRGWADAPYAETTLPGGGTEQQRAEIISKGLVEMAKLVRKTDPNPELEMMTSLYNEEGRMYDAGWLTVPDGVTVGFCDAAMNGMSYSKKFWTEKRDPKRNYGQYFHTQYFGGGPQFAKCTHIEKYLKVNMDAMFERGDTQHMLLAVNEVRHQQLEIRAIAEMLWDYPGFDPREYLQRYCREQFGKEVAPKVAALYDAYYEKYPHTMRNDGFKTYPIYYKVMEAFFTVIANLLNIESGTTDGFKLSAAYNREIYEKGIADLGGVLDEALALRLSIPENRQYFYDYEFVDAIRIIRGIYKLSIATQDAIALLAKDDRAGALKALLDARPLTEELMQAFRHQCSTDKWRFWFRSGTNEDFNQMYNLYQKARLRLETETMSPVTQIEPQRHPYLGNVVMHDPAKAGDALYSTQAERINDSVFNGSPVSITEFPLEDVFQIGGVRSVYRKWKGKHPSYVPDHGLGYQFKLHTQSTLFIALAKGPELEWLVKDGFKKVDKTMKVGRWGWPYRYRNRPAKYTDTYTVYAKTFPAGPVTLGANDSDKRRNPYVVFVKPELLAFENFRQTEFGAQPAGWQCDGKVSVVDVPDYDAGMRETVFDLTTLPRYTPLDLRALKIEDHGKAAFALNKPARGGFELHSRLKAGQNDEAIELSITGSDGKACATISWNSAGKIAANGVAVCDYAADRWYTLTIRYMPSGKSFTVEVQDDALNIARVDDVPLLEKASMPVTKIQFLNKGKRNSSWFMCDAVTGWEMR